MRLVMASNAAVLETERRTSNIETAVRTRAVSRRVNPLAIHEAPTEGAKCCQRAERSALAAAVARRGKLHVCMKRGIDTLGAAILLAALALPMLLVALLIRVTSRGPVLYKQERVGLNGRPFTLLKFRTMRCDAEHSTGPVWASKNDPRRTRLGAVLRRWSIDELPQLVNVLRGEMSLVGPRPERPPFVRKFSDDLPEYALRHGVLPGLSGWAQLNGFRGDTSLVKRLDHDLYYIRNWSLPLDLYIIALTPLCIVTEKNAC